VGWRHAPPRGLPAAPWVRCAAGSLEPIGFVFSSLPDRRIWLRFAKPSCGLPARLFRTPTMRERHCHMRRCAPITCGNWVCFYKTRGVPKTGFVFSPSPMPLGPIGFVFSSPPDRRNWLRCAKSSNSQPWFRKKRLSFAFCPEAQAGMLHPLPNSGPASCFFLPSRRFAKFHARRTSRQFNLNQQPGVRIPRPDLPLVNCHGPLCNR